MFSLFRKLYSECPSKKKKKNKSGASPEENQTDVVGWYWKKPSSREN